MSAIDRHCRIKDPHTGHYCEGVPNDAMSEAVDRMLTAIDGFAEVVSYCDDFDVQLDLRNADLGSGDLREILARFRLYLASARFALPQCRQCGRTLDNSTAESPGSCNHQDCFAGVPRKSRA